jgi:hypothetical protein
LKYFDLHAPINHLSRQSVAQTAMRKAVNFSSQTVFCIQKKFPLVQAQREGESVACLFMCEQLRTLIPFVLIKPAHEKKETSQRFINYVLIFSDLFNRKSFFISENSKSNEQHAPTVG